MVQITTVMASIPEIKISGIGNSYMALSLKVPMTQAFTNNKEDSSA